MAAATVGTASPAAGAASAASPLRVQVLPVEVLGLAGRTTGGAIRTTLVGAAFLRRLAAADAPPVGICTGRWCCPPPG
ncbi:hypothetical protein ACFPM7_28915 [Actinokineospora guangxiensis]|uniref:Secreted protein n=1 Tax=Actinokineospora guangxiensis TaxID=1490288 RepID=A0ABW0EY50_9PSEU